MKRLLLIPIFVALLLVSAILAFNAGLFHSQIQRRASEAIGGRVELGRMSLALVFPFRLTIARSRIEQKGLILEWEKLKWELAGVTPPLDVRVTAVRPKITWSPIPAGSTNGAPAPGATAKGTVKMMPLRLAVRIEQGEFTGSGVTVRALDMTFAQRLLLRSPASLHLKAQVQAQLMPAPVAVSVDTDSLTLSEESIKAQALKATIGGLSADIQGTSLIAEGRHRWLLKVAAPDLSRLPQPPAFVPAKEWRGSIAASVEVNKESLQAPWAAEGHVEATGVSARLAVEQAQFKAEGPFLLNLKTHFVYSDTSLRVPALIAHADLTAAKVRYGDLLNKAELIPLKASVDGSAEKDSFQFKNLNVQLAQVHVQVTGSAGQSPPWISDLKIIVPTVALSGLERILVPLQKSPVAGELALQAAVSGPLSDPMKCRISLNPLKLKGFAAQFDYQKTGRLSARGRVVADVIAQAELVNGGVASARAQGTVNLKDAAMVLGPLRKEERQELAADFTLSNKNEDLVIDRLELRTFFGRMGARGTINTPLKPKLNVMVSAAPLSLSELRLAVPEFRDLIPKGELTGELRLNGPLQTEKPWNDWPMTVSGELAIRLPEYKLASSKPSPPPKAEVGGNPPTPKAGESFLPKGDLTSHARLKLAVDIGQMQKDELTIKRLGMRGLYADTRWRGDVSIGEIFGGSVQLKGLDVPLLDVKPIVQGSVQWSGVVIERALGFAKPEYKSMATGASTGRAEFATLMPGEQDFLRSLKARGEAEAKPVTLNSVKIGEMINDMLKKIPGLNLTPVRVDPLQGEMKAQFDLASETMQLPAFIARDKDGSELQMKGKLILSSMQADLAGTFFWVQSQIKGCVAEGNSDDKGRLVVPLAMKGDLMKPGFALLTDVAGKMAGRALECEKRKAIEKLKREGTEGLQKELDKALKGLFK